MMYKEDFFSGMSDSLHKLILIDQWNKTFFRISRILPEISTQFFLEMVPYLMPKIYMKDDYIVTEGESNTTGFFISVTGELIKYLEPGDFYGEVAIFLRSKRRTATVTSLRDSDFLSIVGEKFEKLLRDFPDDYKKIKVIAKKKLIDNIKMYPSSLFAKFVPSSDIKDYLFRKSIYLDDEEEDKIFNKENEQDELLYVDTDRYKADFERTIRILEKISSLVVKIESK